VSGVTGLVTLGFPAHRAIKGELSIRPHRPTSRTERYPCFDGLRAFAALSVIGVHTAFASGFTGRTLLGRYSARLEIGVSVFFVISGFLLYRPFAASHFGSGDAVATRRFWARRLRRIVPAYWLAFLVITYVLHADVVRSGWGSLAAYLGFAQIYVPSMSLTGITQAWSLCTEMTFYLALPLWALMLGRHRHQRTASGQLRAELCGLGLLVALSVAFRCWVLTQHFGLALVMPNWLPAYTDLFALGMLLAVLSAWQSATGRELAAVRNPAMPFACWALAGVAFVAVSNLGLPLTPVTASPLGVSLVRQTLYGLFALFLVAPAVFGPQDRGLVRGLLRARPLALIGVVSYGVYLWHEAGMTLFMRWTHARLFALPLWELFSVVAAGAILAAAGSYLLVERPVLRAGRSRPRVAGRPAVLRAAAAIPPLAGAAVGESSR
jgi:peptidoglycan/LPS O-acetylase OafA/YrhL